MMGNLLEISVAGRKWSTQFDIRNVVPRERDIYIYIYIYIHTYIEAPDSFKPASGYRYLSSILFM